VYRTEVGYCGGSLPQPTYKAVCNDPSFDDYAESVCIEYSPNVLSFGDVLEAFFRSHDYIAAQRSRQYASIIFAHNDEQYAEAERALDALPRAATTLERVSPFWTAEPYHQKWLLQRKRPLMLALGLTSVDDLLGPAPTILNAAAAGKLRPKVALARLEVLMEDGMLVPSAFAALGEILEEF